LRIAKRLSATIASAAALFVLAMPESAHAQVDVNPPPPNVLLLVDNSGSMEYMMTGTLDANGNPPLPVCNPTNSPVASQANRWATLVQVLTGTIQNFSCEAESRSTNTFKTEYGLNNQAPYDFNYYLPYNRLASNNCVIAPNQPAWPPGPASGGVFGFPTSAITTHVLGQPNTACPVGSQFQQGNDGLMDAFIDRVRFGFMTYDSFPQAGTGLSVPTSVDYTSGPAGMWSYFPSWWTGAGVPVTGTLPNCSANLLEVGARNSAAPPWEGKMIGFGDPTPTGGTATLHQQNQNIQQELLSMRPYGATPTAGLMADAQYYLTGDTMIDQGAAGNSPPPSPLPSFGPAGSPGDPYAKNGCRPTFIILLSDGAPNLDLRPACTGTGAPNGVCPYPTPEQTAYSLANLPLNPVPTYVVGVALSTVTPKGSPTPVNCTTMTQSDLTAPTGLCATNTDPSLQACCSLNRIAYNGGTSHAYFADNPTTLRLALSNILSSIASNTTTRTYPVFSGASLSTNGAGSTAGYSFYSSFYATPGQLWSGVLERQRFVCQSDPNTGILTAQSQPVQAAQGDEFADNPAVGGGNINQSDAAHPRRIYTVAGQLQGGVINSSWTIRGVPPGPTAENPPGPPAITADGLGTYSGTTISGTASSAFVNAVPSQALNVAVAGPALSVCSGKTQASTMTTTFSPAQCAASILSWEIGLPASQAQLPYDRIGNEFGSIFHSTPTIVGPPNDFLRDESYTLFQGSLATRPLVLYTATTDGQLHAFKVGPATAMDTLRVDNGGQNNELWSFMPPAVLPSLQTLFPGVQQVVLDGAPVVRDIILARSGNQAEAASAPWSTILAAGFGSSFGGYYALDVTNPDPTGTPFPATAPKGPQFLWQISTDINGAPLFGTSVTPTITSVFVTPPGQSAAQEIAVAILPGGDGAPTGGQCTRLVSSLPPSNPVSIDPLGKLRGAVQCYAAKDPSRSLTIVRLDNGEVLRRFSNPNATAGTPAQLAARTTNVAFDSPIVGSVVAYPAGPGAISTRAFVGDKDGTMWRLDLTSTDPAGWNVVPFFDAYAKFGPLVGQPISTPPLLSVDPVGNVVVVFSTGDQGIFSASPGMQNYVWSVREQPDVVAGALKSVADWHLGNNEPLSFLPGGITTNWNGGQRVAGPMSLFNGVVYFSSYDPGTSSTNVCQTGNSVLWGVDYLRSNVTGSGDAGPVGHLMIDPMVTDPTKAPPAALEANALIFGVGISRTPPCYTQSVSTDPYLGYGGSVTTPGNIDSGSFSLVVQTGPKANGMMMSGTQQTNVQSFGLPPPPTSVRISSWAAVVE
jgi:type IV pilus assembly protein PilY1